MSLWRKIHFGQFFGLFNCYHIRPVRFKKHDRSKIEN